MLSKKTKYGLNAMIYLAQRHTQGPVLIGDLANEEGISQKFLEAILLELRKQGILQSKKGKGGGYSLGKSPSEITLGQVIRILNGPLAPTPCVSQVAYHKCEECREENMCGIRLVMKDVRNAIANILDHTTLADVLKKVQALKEDTIINYVI